MAKTKIAWAGETWNPISGCTPASEGCANCYASRWATRFRNGDFAPKFHPEKIGLPYGWKRPRLVFVNSMGDLFHEHFKAEIFNILNTIADTPQHQYLILTKRAKRMAEAMEMFYRIRWKDAPLKNLGLGITAENQPRLEERMEYFLRTPAAFRFISLEPLLGSVKPGPYLTRPIIPPDIDPGFDGVDWVIAGGETGPAARECFNSWLEEIFEECQAAGVPFFFKQYGSNFIPDDCDGPECMPHRGCPVECHEEGRREFGEYAWAERRQWPAWIKPEFQKK